MKFCFTPSKVCSHHLSGGKRLSGAVCGCRGKRRLPARGRKGSRSAGQGLSFCRAIASSVGALALTSANPSNSSSSLSPQEFRPLWEQLAYVFDGGIPFCSCFQRRCLLVEDMFVCFCCCLGGDCPAECMIPLGAHQIHSFGLALDSPFPTNLLGFTCLPRVAVSVWQFICLRPSDTCLSVI